MMKKVYLINEQTLKKYTAINDNVDGIYIQQAIDVAQELDLYNALGESLLNKLKDLVASNAILDASNDKYRTLLDKYITPYLCWLVMASIQIELNYKFTNSGMIENYDENKSRIDYKNSQALVSQYEKYASSYGNKMKVYLDKNSNLYPEYLEGCCCNGEEDLQYCDIYLPK